MPQVWTLAACAVVPALVAFGAAGSTDLVSPSISVFMDFDSAPGDAPLRVMEKEVNHLLQPAGIKLDWRFTRDNNGKEAFSGFVVFKFKGECRVEGWSEPAPGETHTLGFTQVRNGIVLPFSEVECDQVRKALAYVNPRASELERQRALGLALGRVVAHELYHMLARTTHHAKEGLAEASQSLRDLVRPEGMTFAEVDSAAIGQGLLRTW